jgi:hypothetical protein
MSIDEISIAEFSEVEVFNFISGRKNRLKQFASFLGFRIHGRDTIALLSDIFIHNLLNRKLVHVSKAENMQRYFTIACSSRPDMYWYNKYQELATKTKEI